MGMSAKKNTETTIAIAAVVAMVFVGSFILLTGQAPEQLQAISTDARVSVSGLSRDATKLGVERIDGVQTGLEGVLSDVYELRVDAGVLEGGDLEMVVAQGVDVTEVTLYQYDRDTLTWFAQSTDFDLERQVVTSPITFGGSTLVVLVSRVLY